MIVCVYNHVVVRDMFDRCSLTEGLSTVRFSKTKARKLLNTNNSINVLFITSHMYGRFSREISMSPLVTSVYTLKTKTGDISRLINLAKADRGRKRFLSAMHAFNPKDTLIIFESNGKEYHVPDNVKNVLILSKVSEHVPEHLIGSKVNLANPATMVHKFYFEPTVWMGLTETIMTKYPYQIDPDRSTPI